MSSFAVPSGWRSPISDATLNSRISLANNVIGTLTPSFNPDTGTITSDPDVFFSISGSMLTAVALFDFSAGTTTYQSFVTGNIEKVYSAHILVQSLPTSTSWGLAAVAAFQAYGDSTMLALAISTWEVASRFLVQPADATAGTQSTRNVTFPSTCNGASVAGGVFLLAEQPSDTRVNSETVGSFLCLSAHLSAITSNGTFGSAAQLSAQFIQSQLYDGTLVQDSITLSDCAKTSDPAQIMADESGFFIEGLSVLSRQDTSWLTLLYELISNTVSSTLWTSSNGINIESTRDSSGPFFFRGLYNAWNETVRNQTSPSPAVAGYIESYVNVQFNALQELASSPGGNQYSISWIGPPASSTDPLGQYYALEVFNSEIAFASEQGSNSTTSPTASSTSNASATSGSATTSPTDMTSISTSANHKSHVGAIVGGILGGLGLLLISLALLILWLRRRRENYARNQLEATAVPFTKKERRPAVSAEKAQHFERPRLMISSQSNLVSSSPAGHSSGFTSTNQHLSHSTEQASPTASSSVLHSPGNTETPSIQGIYHLLTTLITSIQSPHVPEEQPPQYDETRRGLV